jgi:hypothetical protein
MPDDTLTIAAEAARDAVEQRRLDQGAARSVPASGLLARLDKTTLTALIACVGVLATQAEQWLSGMVRDDETALARAIDARIELTTGIACEAMVEELRGEVEDAATTPPTIADLADKQRDDRARIYVLERILDVGEYRREHGR